MQIHPYLVFDGNCEQAFKFYEKALDGVIETLMPHKGTPAAGHMPPDWDDKILHARLNAKGGIIMGSDAPPSRYKPNEGFSVSINIQDVAEAERVFAALAEGGKVQMALAKTFWAERFGMLIDKFGIPWMVNCEGAPH